MVEGEAQGKIDAEALEEHSSALHLYCAPLDLLRGSKLDMQARENLNNGVVDGSHPVGRMILISVSVVAQGIAHSPQIQRCRSLICGILGGDCAEEIQHVTVRARTSHKVKQTELLTWRASAVDAQRGGMRNSLF